MATNTGSGQLPLKIISLNICGLAKKATYLKNLIIKHKPDFLCLQETNIHNKQISDRFLFELGLNKGIFNYANTNGNGTAILQTSDKWDIIDEKNYLNGRANVVTIRHQNENFKIINTYAPALGIDRKTFYNDLTHIILNYTDKQNIILLGDFNVTLEDRDTVGVSNSHQPGRKELENLVSTLNLQDSHRKQHLDKFEFTFSHRSIHRFTRIDRIYTPDTCKINNLEYLDQTLTFTDHKGILIVLGDREVRRFSPHWKFNDLLLENQQFLETVRQTIKYTTENNNSDINIRLDNLRIAIKKIAQHFGKIIKKEREITIDKLENRLINSPDLIKLNENEYYETKKQLEELYNIKYNGAKIRSKIKNLEKPIKSFLNLENNIQKNKLINEIIDMDGNLIKDKTEIATSFKDFYQDLYSEETADNDVQKTYLKHCKKLDDEDRDFIDADININDLKKALNDMNENASPGPNGLTVKFYKTFFNDLSPLLEQLLVSSFEKEGISDNLNKAYITLIPKDSGPKNELKNYRPISLLNIEYKMITKALTNKASPFLNSIIDEDQACAIKDRTIISHNHKIRDLISLTNDKEYRNVILSIDQAKAFDRVSHSWLMKVLENYNFGPNFIKWIKILYKNQTSHILVNHTLSDAIKLGRGVRQGDSLSMMLYILSLEPLLESIRQDTDITGIQIPNDKTQKLIAYADDTNFFPNNYYSINKIISHFKIFGKASGTKININKSKIMGLGTWNYFKELEGIEWVNQIKIFGLTYENKKNQKNIKFWKNILEKINKLSEIYFLKDATIFGRAIIINTVLEPKFLYATHVFDPPKKIIKKYNQIIRKYLLKNTITKIKQNTLTQQKIHGGVNLHNIEQKINSFRLKYFINFLEKKDHLTNYYLSLHIRKYLNFDNSIPHFSGKPPEFYLKLKNLITKNEILIKQEKPKNFYKILNEKQQTPLWQQIKKAEIDTDFKTIFKDLHENKFINNIQRQITYRLLYNITPTSEGIYRVTNIIQKCKICHKHIENENHIYYFCPMLGKTKKSLKALLRIPNYTNREFYNDIFLATTRKDVGKNIRHYRLTLVTIYRDICWEARVGATYRNQHFTKDSLDNNFKAKTREFTINNIDIQTLQQLYDN